MNIDREFAGHVLLAALLAAAPWTGARGTHIPTTRDVAGLRSPMPFEGYLAFDHSAASGLPGGGGEERTGWTDVRHPGNDAYGGATSVLATLRDTTLGYDISDNLVKVDNKRVTVDGAAGDQAPAPDIARDYDFAGEAWAQAGISVLDVGVRDVDFSTGNAAGNTAVSLPVDVADRTVIQAANRAAAPVVNNWYAPTGTTGNPGTLRGVTRRPTSATDGVMIFDNAANDTFAHELGHYLLDDHRFAPYTALRIRTDVSGGTFTLTFDGQTTAPIPHDATAAQVQAALEALSNLSPGDVTVSRRDTPPGTQYTVRTSASGALTADGAALTGGAGTAANRATVAAGDTTHSATADDLMAFGSLRNLPGTTPKGDGNPAPRDPGRENGNLGSVDHLDETVQLNGTGPALSQIEAVHRSPSVQEDDNGRTHGDKADFDWVEDNGVLEQVTTSGDNHPGVDFLLWEINPQAVDDSEHRHDGSNTTSASDDTAHDHDGWGILELDAFDDPFFRTIDIVSQVARYTDMDVKAGDWSFREAALDFAGFEGLFPEFSVDGSTWVAGSLISVFIDGWTLASSAENYVSRWRSPFDATLVRLNALNASGHDFNTQIDAIIASRFVGPLPSTFGMLLIAAALLLLRRRRGVPTPASAATPW